MGMATIPAISPQIIEMQKALDETSIPEFIMNCPVYYGWTKYKGEDYFGMINYERSVKAKRPMIDLAYCATKGMNGVVEKTVMYSKKHFSESHLK